jgi:hypothetical protein
VQSCDLVSKVLAADASWRHVARPVQGASPIVSVALWFKASAAESETHATSAEKEVHRTARYELIRAQRID